MTTNTAMKRYLIQKGDLVTFVLAFQRKYMNQADQVGNPDNAVSCLPLAKELKGFFLTPKVYMFQMKEFSKAFRYDYQPKPELPDT